MRFSSLKTWAAGVGRDRRGGTAMIVALCVPVLAVMTTGGVELAFVLKDKSALQDAADAAALFGASELTLASTAGVARRTEAIALVQAEKVARSSAVSSTADLIERNSGVRVRMTGTRSSFFGDLLPPGGFITKVEAIAMRVGITPLCVLAHGENAGPVLRIRDKARMLARDCMVQSNDDLVANTGAMLKADVIQAVGLAVGVPEAQVGAEVIPDPFTDRDLSPPGRCKSGELVVLSKPVTYTLAPGLHCDDLTVTGSAVLKLAPGEHYFLNSRLSVTGGAKLTGTDVVLLFDHAAFEFVDDARVDLFGRRSGPLAGFLVIGVAPQDGFTCGENTPKRYTDETDSDVRLFENGQFKPHVTLKLPLLGLSIGADPAGGGAPSASYDICRPHLGSEFLIASDRVQNLLGVLYVPSSKLTITGEGAIAEDSDWTVMVAQSIEVRGKPTLVINADYGALDGSGSAVVPMPEAAMLGPVQTRLAR